jgi:hypothetical protein
MFKRSIFRIVFLVTLGLTLVAAPILPAAAQPTSATAELGQTATLVANGAAVAVPVVYSCSSDTASASIDLFVTERVGGNRTAQGNASTFGLVCDGTQHTAVVTVPSGNGNAFHQGTAFVQGVLSACDPNGICSTVPFSGTIRVVKK